MGRGQEVRGKGEETSGLASSSLTNHEGVPGTAMNSSFDLQAGP